jgi:hypothetical protein
MPQTTLWMLSACLWDLRSLCEQQLRALTDAQRLTDEFREQPAMRAVLKGKLVEDFDVVLRSTALVRESARECAGMVEGLPVVTGDQIQPT